MAAEQDNNSPDIQQSQSNLGIGNMQDGTINGIAAGQYNDNSTTNIFNSVPEDALLKALENPGKADGIGILRTGDPAKTTKDWQGREEELKTLTKWLNDPNVLLVGIEAIAFHQQSLDIKREIGDRQGEASSLGNLGNAYKNLGEYQRAIAFHQQSLEIKREIGNIFGQGVSLINLGKTNLKLKQYETSWEYASDALQIFKQVGSLHGQAEVYKVFAELLFEQHNYSEANQYCDQAPEICRQTGLFLTADCEELKQKIQEAIN